MVQAEYLYNALGQQVVRRLTQDANTIHSIHDLDGNRIAEYEIDAFDGTSTLLREYVWLQGAPVAVVEGGQIYFIHTDHIGRPVFATDSAGTKVWEASYTPFGDVETTTGTPIALRFPGQWFQAESGLHQNWMRDFDPTTGRYIQADPLGLVDGASVYGYALQNPGRYVDPTGEFIPLLTYVPLIALTAFGLWVDSQLEQCGCSTTSYDTAKWAAVGAVWSEFGPTIPRRYSNTVKGHSKANGREMRMGRTSRFTSRFSDRLGVNFPGTKGSNQRFRNTMRNFGKNVWRGNVFFGATFAGIDSYRLARCWGYL
ncbi:MAG: RHS repeat-associated core domain-containing protein [Pseudomonadota bacterium]